MITPASKPRIAPLEITHGRERDNLALFCTILSAHPHVMRAVIAEYSDSRQLQAAAEDRNDDRSIHAMALGVLGAALEGGDPTARLQMDMELEYQVLVAEAHAEEGADTHLVRLGALAGALAIEKDGADIRYAPWPEVYGGQVPA